MAAPIRAYLIIRFSRDAMMSVAEAFFITAWLLIPISGIWAQSKFSALINIEIQDYLEEWKRDGKPYVWFSQSPREEYDSWWERRISAAFSTQWLSWRLLFFTPRWIRSNVKASELLNNYRIGLLISWCSILTFVLVGFFFFQPRP